MDTPVVAVGGHAEFKIHTAEVTGGVVIEVKATWETTQWFLDKSSSLGGALGIHFHE